MAEEVGAGAVALVAHVAREPALGVSPHVLAQALLVGEHFVAQLAHVLVLALALTSLLVPPIR